MFGFIDKAYAHAYYLCLGVAPREEKLTNAIFFIYPTIFGIQLFFDQPLLNSRFWNEKFFNSDFNSETKNTIQIQYKKYN